jgi:DNA invertase Pin-like site-specific DNA recombinase
MRPHARIWLRVSTDDQVEENQLEGCQRRVAYGDRGECWQFNQSVDVYRAHGVRGDDMDNPIRQRVFIDAQAGRFNVLVVWALDRWTRGGIVALLNDLETFRKLGVRLVSVQEEWADNELIAAVVAWSARQEVLRRGERVRAGHDLRRRQVRERGGFVSQAGIWRTTIGRPGRAVTADEAAAALRLHGEGLSYRTISRQLAEAFGGAALDPRAIWRAVQRLLRDAPPNSAKNGGEVGHGR